MIEVGMNYSDTASPALLKTIGALTDRTEMNQEIGAAVRTLVSEYLVALESQRNESAAKLGAAKSGFLATIGQDQTSFDADNNEAVVNIDNAAMGRAFHDMDIVPKVSKYLTLPANAEAYNKRARSFDDLHVMLRRIGGVVRAIGLAKWEGKVEEPYYWFVKAVHQVQDRTLLPSDESIAASAISAAKRYLADVIRTQEQGEAA